MGVKISGVQVYICRCSGVQHLMFPGVQMGVQAYRLAFRFSGMQVFRFLGTYRLDGFQVSRVQVFRSYSCWCAGSWVFHCSIHITFIHKG